MAGSILAAAPAAADVVLVLELALAVLLLVGTVVVRRRRVRLHRYLQGSIVLLNLPLAAVWMVPRFVQEVVPDLPSEWAEPFYLLPTIALALGVAAELLGVYIVLVATTTWIPERWRFRNYKRWMRAELALWWLVVGVGIAIYASWYLGPSGGS